MKKLALLLLLGTLSPAAFAQDDEESEGLFGLGVPLYVAVDYVIDAKLSVSDSNVFPEEDFDTNFYVAHVGTRYKAIGFELQYGLGDDDNDPDYVETDQYYGAFVVPTGTVRNIVEIAFPIGYTRMTLKQGDLEDDFEGGAYGVNLQLPLKRVSESLPDLRIVAGAMVYQQNVNSRIYGWHAGLRYDFKI